MIGFFSALTIGKVLDFLRSPLAALIGVIVLAGGSFIAGHHVAAKACQAEKQASIDAARQIDRKAAREAIQRTEAQAEQNLMRAAEAERQLTEYRDELAKRPDANCALLDPDVERLQPNELSGRPTVAPIPPKRRSGSDAKAGSQPRR